MRIWLIIAAVALTAGCMFGDPRTTEIENKSAQSISVSFVDGAFNMSGKVEIEPNSTGNLAPNYQFSDLKNLKIVEGKRSYDMQPSLASRLSSVCSGYCTLSYGGGGHLTTRVWEYQQQR